MNKSVKDNKKMLTPKQKKVVFGILENMGNKKPKSYGEILRESGYSEAIASNPKQIINSPTIQREVEPYIEKLKEVRSQALNTISQKKLYNSTAKDLASIASMLTKDHQLLTGQATEHIKGILSLSDLYDQAEKE